MRTQQLFAASVASSSHSRHDRSQNLYDTRHEPETDFNCTVISRTRQKYQTGLSGFLSGLPSSMCWELTTSFHVKNAFIATEEMHREVPVALKRLFKKKKLQIGESFNQFTFIIRLSLLVYTVVPLLKDTLWRGHPFRKDTNSWQEVL